MNIGDYSVVIENHMFPPKSCSEVGDFCQTIQNIWKLQNNQYSLNQNEQISLIPIQETEYLVNTKE